MKVLKFGARWCLGCTIMRPRWKEIEDENSWLNTEYYDYDKDKTQIKKYNINNELPVFVFLNKSNEEIERVTGTLSKEQITKLITKHKNK